MNKELRKFSLGQVLTVITGKILCDIDEVYNILNYLTRSELLTHQLPRASIAVKPHLEKWMEDNVPLFDKIDPDEICPENARAWLSGKEKIFGDTFFLPPLPYGIYSEMDPIDALANIRKGEAKHKSAAVTQQARVADL